MPCFGDVLGKLSFQRGNPVSQRRDALLDPLLRVLANDIRLDVDEATHGLEGKRDLERERRGAQVS